ncbi:MAG: beta-propeller domain-containing protein [Candidatus Gracilibacteria bacterium]|nr:beta-propeller domain-containing protein [Candidatus Gracilibacteria bacterium]
MYLTIIHVSKLGSLNVLLDLIVLCLGIQEDKNTLVHKINIDGSDLSYQDSTIIPGSPLTQYSMDEYKGDFRILTKVNNWSNKGDERYTNLYILDKDLKLKIEVLKI